MKVALLCATGVMELYMSRVNLSIAIVAMVRTVVTVNNSTDTEKLPFCLRMSNSTNHAIKYSHAANYTHGLVEIDTDSSFSNADDEFRIPMTTTQRGNILSAFFYAYAISGILGGRLSEVYGTKRVFGFAVLVDGIANFLIPTAAKSSYIALFALRFVMGFSQGLCFPSLHCLVSRWIPPAEVSRFLGFVYVSNSFGTIFTLTVCGVIISEYGWEVAFYVCGALSFVWLALWAWLMHDTPQKHPSISESEKQYICEALNVSNTAKPDHVPWKALLLSVPLWSVHIAHAGNMFGLSFFITQLPLYFSSIIGVDIKSNGALSSLPFLARFIGSNVFCWLSNYLMKKIYLHPKVWRILITIIGYAGPAVCILLVGYSGCSAYVVLTFFIVALALNGATTSGYLCNHLELAPNFAGTTMGLSSTVGFLYAMIGPVLVGVLTPQETATEWRSVCWLVFANFAVTATIYCIFLSTKIQSWNNPKSKQEYTLVK